MTPYADHIRPTGAFPLVGFVVHTGTRPGWYEVALATDPTLFGAAARHRRTAANFFSTRADGPLLAEDGTGFYLLPAAVLARFAGHDRLFYALATFARPEPTPAEVRFSGPTPFLVPHVAPAPAPAAGDAGDPLWAGDLAHGGGGNSNGNGNGNGTGNGDGNGNGNGSHVAAGYSVPGGHALPPAAAPTPAPPGAGGRVSVVIPTLNEARNIGWVLGRLPALVDEVVLVDGRSTDGTVDVARSLRPDVVVVEEPRPGKGAALRAGFRASTGDFVVMIDADGSMDPAEIGRHLGLLHEGYDFVKGSRFIAGGGSHDLTALRRTGNRGLMALVNVLYRSPFTDLCYGFCAFRRSALERLGASADGFEIETELVVRAVKAGLLVAEVPSFERSRLSGESHLRTFRDGQRVLRTLLRERWALPPRPVPADPGFGPVPAGLAAGLAPPAAAPAPPAPVPA